MAGQIDQLNLLIDLLENLVENAAIIEVLRLSLGPTAEVLVDGDQLQFLELVLELGCHLGVTRAVEVLRGDALAFLAVQVCLLYTSPSPRD